MENSLFLSGETLQIKGATKVVSSTQNQAVIEDNEALIVISGSEIEVKKLNLDDNEVELKGKFTNIKLSHAGVKKVPLLKRIFK